MKSVKTFVEIQYLTFKSYPNPKHGAKITSQKLKNKKNALKHICPVFFFQNSYGQHQENTLNAL